MKKSLFCLLLLIPFSFLHATNSDTLNRYNAAKKKDGYWLVYLDSLLKPADSAQSFFYGYELYDNGEALFSFSRFPLEIPKKYSFGYDAERGEKGKPVLLNGSFRVYYPQGWKYEEQTFAYGRPVQIRNMIHEKNDPDIAFSQTLYFDQLYNGQAGSYYYEEKEQGAAMVTGYFRKGEKGWQAYPGKTE